MERYKALIIGPGNIGAFYDDPSREDVCLTHGHALNLHPGFELAGFLGRTMEKAALAADIWGGKAYTNIAEVFADYKKIDLVVVAVPDMDHARLMSSLCQQSVRMFMLEKPLAASVAEADDIVKKFRGSDKLVTVNYTRRYLPVFQQIRNDITAGAYGRLISGNAYYGKGIKHNGSHLIDILRFFFGDIRILHVGPSIVDYEESDPSASFNLVTSGGGYVSVGVLDCREYTVFELDLFFQKGRIRIVDSGAVVEFYEVKDNGIFDGYKKMALNLVQPTNLERSLWYVIDAAYNNLAGNAELVCPLEDAAATLRMCDAISRVAQGVEDER